MVDRRSRRSPIPRLVVNIGIYLGVLAIFIVMRNRSPLAIVGMTGAALAVSIYAGLLIVRLTEARRS